MAEQRTQSGGGHGAAALGTFEGDEQSGRVGERPLDPQIVLEGLDGFAGQGQKTFLVAFAEYQDLRFGKSQVFQPQIEDFAGAESIEQHQGHQGEVTKRAKAVPKLGDLLGG